MWLTCSSIGRKLVMAVTGACLVLFVTFHVLMNAVALAWPTAYNQVCEFLGANWYALVASVGLAALFIVHIIYAVWLTIQNRKARGTDRYAVTSRPPQVEWSSKNMLVLGIVILAFLVVHLIQFWAKMQWQELRHAELAVLPQLSGAPVPPAMGTLFLQMAFSQPWTAIVYIVGFIALWFHMNHGFWSMFHTAGWDNGIWIERLKKIGCWWTTVVVALFIAQAIVFTVLSHEKYYEKDIALQEQYAAYWDEHAEKANTEFRSEMVNIQTQFNDMQNQAYEKQQQGTFTQDDAAAMEAKQQELDRQGLEAMKKYVAAAEPMIKYAKQQAPDMHPMNLIETEHMVESCKNQIKAVENQLNGTPQMMAR
ncbi:MAG: succinate dehydrogenase cytochrome b subunit [Muribaculaceae bacterium]|nr:succinate dehydrogenase cytochrome b subunit [Muribaculaceae bacterium]